MKKIFSCLLALMILSITMLPCFAAAPVVSVSASTTNISVGDTVTVYVNLPSDSNLTMIRLSVSYPTTHFELVSDSVSSGKLFDYEEVGVSPFIGTSEEPVVAGGTLLKMNFKVKQCGGTISVNVLASDGVESAVGGSLTFKDCAHANMKWENVKPSTCKEAGTKKGTCPCGFTKEEPLPLGEHKFGEPAVTKQPTCTETGTQVEKCTVCGTDGTPSTVPAKGHQFDDASIKQKPTCTQPGTAVGKCNACGFESSSPVTIPAKGHSFGAWVVTREPNQLMNGEKRRVCNDCQYIESQPIDRLTATEDPTEPSTNPIETPTQPITPVEPEKPIVNNNNKPDNNKDDEDKKGGFAGLFDDETPSSDKSVVVVIVLAVVTVVVLAIYILLLQQRKKSE